MLHGTHCKVSGTDDGSISYSGVHVLIDVLSRDSAEGIDVMQIYLVFILKEDIPSGTNRLSRGNWHC